jgi:hypothetical protein
VKAPDYAGHVYNYLSLRQKFALLEVDRQIARVAEILERFDGQFMLIVTADRGQCPTVNLSGGVRSTRSNQEDIEASTNARCSAWSSVVPSEITSRAVPWPTPGSPTPRSPPGSPSTATARTSAHTCRRRSSSGSTSRSSRRCSRSRTSSAW